MADGWLLWCGGALAVVFLVLLTLAGMPLVGVFLGAVVWLSARRAVKPEARVEVDDTLRGTCDPVAPRDPCGGSNQAQRSL